MLNPPARVEVAELIVEVAVPEETERTVVEALLT